MVLYSMRHYGRAGPCISRWLNVDETLLPAIREVYNQEIKEKAILEQSTKVDELKDCLGELEGQEAKLARMYLTGKINEITCGQGNPQPGRARSTSLCG